VRRTGSVIRQLAGSEGGQKRQRVTKMHKGSWRRVRRTGSIIRRLAV
jgi:hypothetical protein